MFSYISSKYPNANPKPHLLGSKIYPIKSLLCKNMCMLNLFAKIWARIAIGWVPKWNGLNFYYQFVWCQNTSTTITGDWHDQLKCGELNVADLSHTNYLESNQTNTKIYKLAHIMIGHILRVLLSGHSILLRPHILHEVFLPFHNTNCQHRRIFPLYSCWTIFFVNYTGI